MNLAHTRLISGGRRDIETQELSWRGHRSNSFRGKESVIMVC